MKNKKKKFLIAVEWSDCAEIEVEANSLEEALKIADKEGVSMATQNKEYIGGSFQVNEEFSKYLNSKLGKQVRQIISESK
ncbi:MAG TPA: hypothetical protein VMW10_11600 [Alphaproteobacteria bacterium]|nr:hypothetical protein [Alphaproteobacteria bacterium]